jgi:hypothetical protein
MGIHSAYRKPFCQNDQLKQRRIHRAGNMALKTIQCQREF